MVVAIEFGGLIASGSNSFLNFKRSCVEPIPKEYGFMAARGLCKRSTSLALIGHSFLFSLERGRLSHDDRCLESLAGVVFSTHEIGSGVLISEF